MTMTMVVRICARAITLIVSLLVGLVALRLLRRTWSPEVREKAHGSVLIGLLAFRGILLGLGGTLAYCAAGSLIGDLPSLSTLAILGLHVAALVALCVLVRDRVFVRANWRSRRGDYFGAIAELQAEFDRYALKVGIPISPSTSPGSIPPRDRDRMAYHFKGMGDLHLVSEDYLAARDWYEGAVRIGGPTPRHLAALGVALFKTGRADEGIVMLREACASPVDDGSLDRCEMVIALAAALIKQREHVEARRWLEQGRATVRPDSLVYRRRRRELARKIEELWDRTSACA